MTTLIISPAPERNVFTISLSLSLPTMPMRMARNRNHVVASWKYHSPSGRPVKKADQPSNAVTPKLPQGMKPITMTTNAAAKMIRQAFCVPESFASAAISFSP